MRLSRLRQDSERGSIPLVMLVSFLSITLCSLLLPAIVRQSDSTKSDKYRQLSLAAAQAGISVALAQIRAASDTSTRSAGSYYKLPCGPFRGTVDAAGGDTERYGVTITYYDADPNSTSTVAHVIACTPGNGTSNGTSAYVPYFALICSGGSATPQPATDDFTASTCSFGHPGDRVLKSTYTFATTNANVPGGSVQIYTGSQQLCWDVGSSPVVNGNVYASTCKAGLTSQQFIYTSQLQIEVASTIGTTTPLCFDTGDGTTHYPHAIGDLITLQACSNTYPVAIRQRWARGAGSRAGYIGSTTNKTILTYPNDGLCISEVSAESPGTQLALATCNATTFTDTQSWTPSPTVGVGNADNLGYNYLANWGQFSRCVDVSGFYVTNTLQVYPCKQTWLGPQKSVDWNQQFTYDSSTRQYITMNHGSDSSNVKPPKAYIPTDPYCMYTMATGPITTAKTYSSALKVTSCLQTAVPMDKRQWTLHTDKSKWSTDVLYTITDEYGNCLTPQALSYASQVSGLYVGACDGSAIQKWNANAAVLSPTPLKNTNEK